MSGNTETVRLVQQQDYQFKMVFGGTAPDWLADEPPPMGQGAGIAIRVGLRDSDGKQLK